MYLAYSLLTLLIFVVVSPYFLYQAIHYQKYIGSLRQRLGYLPISFNVDGEESIWIHAVSVGDALTSRAISKRVTRGCGCFSPRPRWPGTRWRAAACSTWTPSSIFRSTGRSSSGG